MAENYNEKQKKGEPRALTSLGSRIKY